METTDAVITLVAGCVLYVILPALFILLIVWMMRALKRQQARVDEAMAATHKTHALQEESNKLLREILETLRQRASP